MAIENRGPQLQAVEATFLAIAFVATALRCYVRAGIVKAFGIDDWFMVAAIISMIVYSACSMTGIHYGTGRHYADLSHENIKTARKFWWLCYTFYSTTMISSKISIALFLLRIAVKKIHAWIIYIAMALTVVTGVVFFFVSLFQCSPISFFWNKNQPGSCINVDVIIGLAYLYSASSVISDFTFAILPIFLIWKLKMDQRTKYALIPLLAMGCIASSAVVARFPYMKGFKNPDFLYATTDIAIWSTVEQGLAITAASLATLRPLFKKLGVKMGYSSGPSAIGPSGHDIGAGTGRGVGGGSRAAAHRSFTLDTFAQHDDAWTGQDIEANPNPAPGRRRSLIPSKRSSLWRTKAVSENESEEELHLERSKEALGEAPSVTPKSFLATEGHNK